MTASPERPRRMIDRIPKLLRYGAVSAIATATSLIVLGILVSTRATSPALANVIATAVGTVPSFEPTRRWVWHKTGARSVGAEVVPFCVLSFTGLVLSTLAVAGAAHWAGLAGIGGFARTLAIESANVAAFGSLWITQYLLLDHVLFRHDQEMVVTDPARELRT